MSRDYIFLLVDRLYVYVSGLKQPHHVNMLLHMLTLVEEKKNVFIFLGMKSLVSSLKDPFKFIEYLLLFLI